jgi:hypothetical protein
MSGFAILFDPDSQPKAQDSDFQGLMQKTSLFKRLNLTGEQVASRTCRAVKFDSASSLHRGITHDLKTGSWILAAGTVVALVGNNDPNSILEALLLDYLENGLKTLERYDGQFVLAIYNGCDNTLSIITDPMGHFSVFYSYGKKQILFSTSALAIARQISAKPDTLAVECFLRTGRLHGERTLWQDVKRVRPATVLTVTSAKLIETEYWTPTFDETVARQSLDDALNRAGEIISSTFKRALQREGKVWADLTGGFDTRVTAMFMAQSKIPFTAYCVGPVDHPDVQVSKLICQQMGWEYQHMPLPEGWEEEQQSWFETALYKGDAQLNVLQLAGVLRGQTDRSHTYPVHVPGTGVDEWRYHIYNAKSLGHTSSTKVNYDEILDARILFPIPNTVLRHDRNNDVRTELKEHFIRLASGYRGFPVSAQTDIMFLRHRHPIHAGAYLSAEAGIMRSLMPFCFKEPENYGFSLNDNWRVIYQYRFVRGLLEKGNLQLASIRTAKGEPALPIRVTNAYKFGPLWKYFINLASEKASNKFLKKPLTIWPKHHTAEYPLPAWRIAWLKWAMSEELLSTSQMYSGAIYNTPVLMELAAQAMAKNNQAAEFLDRVITIEMAMRAVGSCID